MNKKKKKVKSQIWIDPMLIGVVLGIILMIGTTNYILPNMNIRLENIEDIFEMENLFKMVLACVSGSIIGMERSQKNRPAGLRTHALVAVGATIVMIISLEMFEKYHHLTNADPMRLGAQVISGIGFLGAGTIIRNGVNVKGLTTAASLWAVATIGLAIGSGLYQISILGTLIIYFTLRVLWKFEKRNSMKSSNLEIYVLAKNQIGQFGFIGQALAKYNIKILKVDIDEQDEEDENIEIYLQLSVPYDVEQLKLVRELEGKMGIIKVEIEN